MLQPLFEYITDPSKIEFEDDILLAIKALVRKKKAVTETIWRMVPCFNLILEKNKHAFGLLLETVNVILINGRDHLALPENGQLLAHFVRLAQTSLFSQEAGTSNAPSTRISNNAEAAILLQLIVQMFEGTQALHNEIFEKILAMTLERINICAQAEKDLEKRLLVLLKKHLLGVFLAGAVYSPQATVLFLTQRNLLSGTLNELFQLAGEYKFEYERKLFIEGLCRLCSVGQTW